MPSLSARHRSVRQAAPVAALLFACLICLSSIAPSHSASLKVHPGTQDASYSTLKLAKGQSDDAATPRQTPFLVWTGFDHQWQRQVLGFQTPHRMGTFANWIELTSDDDSGGVSATAHFSFTPGVDGDFGKTALFSSVVKKSQAVSSASDHEPQSADAPIAHADSFSFSFTDNATHT
eukprot:Opistho-2@84450